MYTSFRTQNFKGFKDLAFDDLACVNLSAGKNNTGKTSVLEAVLIHSGEYLPENFLRIRKLDNIRQTRERGIEGLFQTAIFKDAFKQGWFNWDSRIFDDVKQFLTKLANTIE